MTTPRPSACLLLPYPPSVWRLYAGKGKNRHKSDAYRTWLDEAWLAVQRQPRQPALSGPVSMDIALGRPDKRRRDLDNPLKAIADLLVSAGVLEDDSQVEKLNVYWCPETTGARVFVEPYVKGKAA